jgi:membrane fusion protein, heavy metal efflux system
MRVSEAVSAATLFQGLPSRTIVGLLSILIGLGLGVAGYGFVAMQWGSPDTSGSLVQDVPAAQAPFSRVGDRITVPPGSLLRSQLVVSDVASKDVFRSLVLPALVEVDPARTVKVLPPVAGRIIDLKVQLGGRVKEGQLLAVIDSGDLAQAYSDIEKARSTTTLTKKTLDRLISLEKGGGVPVKEREQAQSDSAQAVSELARSETRLRALGIPAEQPGQSRLLSLKSPISGSIIDSEAAPGAFLNDLTAAIMTIANLDTIWVTANVPEKDISFIFTGQTVNVVFASYPDKIFTGKVLFISDVIEPDTRRAKVRVAFDNPDLTLKPNMFADATFVAPPVSRLVVPTSALLMTNDKTSVFVELEEWVFERRDVEIDYEEGAIVATKSGLRPGERVVVKGAVRLND